MGKIVWQREFNCLFAQMPNQTIGKWNFYHVGSGEQQASHYYQLRDWAKVRFSCAQCGNGWTSMRGMVQFDVEISLITQPERVIKIGNIYATMYGQKCQKCLDERFEQAMWYPEEVTKVLENLHCRIRQVYYGEQLQSRQIRVERRPGKPRNP